MHGEGGDVTTPRTIGSLANALSATPAGVGAEPVARPCALAANELAVLVGDRGYLGHFDNRVVREIRIQIVFAGLLTAFLISSDTV